MEMVEAPSVSLGLDMPELPSGGLAKETYASFLLLAIATFTLAGYVGLALFFVGVVR